MRLILRILAYAAGVWLAVLLVDGLEFTGSAPALLAIAVILGAVNAVVKPIVTFLSLPAIILTLGLFLLIVNTLMFALTIWLSGMLDLGLSTTGFAATFLGALVLTVVAWAGERLVARAD